MTDNALKIAWWMMYDDCDCELDQAMKHLDWAREEKHRGDCTNEPFTCMRCQYEEAERMAARLRSENLVSQ